MNMPHLDFAANWAWQTSLAALPLIALAFAATVFLRKPVFSPIRHLLGLLIVVRLLLPVAPSSPFSIFNFLNKGEIPGSATSFEPQPAFTSPALLSLPSVTPIPQTPSPTFKWKSMLPPIWAAGFLALLTRVLVQHTRVQSWMKSERRITNGPAHEALADALGQLDVRRSIALYSIPEISVPAVFGAFRPAILLPATLLQNSNPEALRLILLHEIAHINRRDVLIKWLVILARSLHWFNPFAWFAIHRLAAEQELLCDGDVMRLLNPNEQRAYADTLLTLASSPSRAPAPTAIAISSSFKQMKERIVMIRQFKPATYRLLLFTLPPLAAIIALLTFTGAVKKPVPSKLQPAETGVDSDPSSKEKTDKLLDTLQQELDSMSANIRARQEEMDHLRDRFGFQPTADGNDIQPSETLIALQHERIRAEQEFLQLNQLYQSLKPMGRSQLRQTLPTARHDETLDRLLAERAKVQQQIALLDKDYAAEHPERKRTEALFKNIETQIEDRIDGIMAGMEALVSSRKAAVDLAQKSVNEAQARESEIRRNSRSYFQIKRDVENLQKVRDGLFLRLHEERLNALIANSRKP